MAWLSLLTPVALFIGGKTMDTTNTQCRLSDLDMHLEIVAKRLEQSGRYVSNGRSASTIRPTATAAYFT
jgi:hypothetical protein